MDLNNTPRASRLHIGIFGRRNAGKSTLINALTNQEISLVSDVAGTTTDPVYKSMEINGIGPCVFIDTAGFDDEGELGKKRIEQTKKALNKTDVAIIIFTDEITNEEKHWVETLCEREIPFIPIINKADIITHTEKISKDVEALCKKKPIWVSAKTNVGVEKLRYDLISSVPDDFHDITITGSLVNENDLVLLVMPQDIQAPKGRLILPQVQTLRELLDKKCVVMSCTTDKLDITLQALIHPPKLIITDSQVFSTVYEKKPSQSRLTSFSVLFAQYKGDIDYFVDSTAVLENLKPNAKILIAEACTHVPLKEDIGREKLPRMLRSKYGDGITIDHVNGSDFPNDLSGYDLVIQCGACMFNRRFVLSRVNQAKHDHVPMTNYGVVLAYLSNILDKIDY
ncbi:MAG TPA: [FeFe] hydrogenase H-cluster maturation GTPase HydF [Clostridiales bacterium]|nr:[FeFe] hydrogenase H-cluster maturation GTPase HydF [Clostridiales bacterium]